jgi:hypothetical protein
MPNGRPDPAHTALVRGSFAPPEPIRRLRDLTRARTRLTAERSREVRRLERFLEDTGIKPSSVAGDIMGVSGQAMPEALIAGVNDPGGPPDPAVPADPAKRRLRNKIPALVEALTGRFTEHHAFPGPAAPGPDRPAHRRGHRRRDRRRHDPPLRPRPRHPPRRRRPRSPRLHRHPGPTRPGTRSLTNHTPQATGRSVTPRSSHNPADLRLFSCQTLRRARRSVVDTHPRNLHIRCLRGHRYGNRSLSSTPQHLFTAGAMSSDPTAGMY